MNQMPAQRGARCEAVHSRPRLIESSTGKRKLNFFDSPVERAVELINAAETKAKLRANTDAAVAARLFGVPTLQIGEELFWGADALPMARAYLDNPALFRSGEMLRVATMGASVTRPAAAR